jgi:hypothetical protein
MADMNNIFTQRDYTASFERLLALLSVEVPELTDRNHSDGGISLIRLLSRETDLLSFYIDEVFLEGYLSTARFRQSLVDIGATVGYTPVLASAAASVVRVTRGGGYTRRIVLPRFMEFTRADGLIYSSVAASAISATPDYADVQVLQGVAHTLSLGASDFEYLDNTNKLKYNLGMEVAAGTVEIIHADESVVWTQVDSFWRSTSTDWHYMLELDGETDNVYLVIGDGVQGSLLSFGDITVTYITTDGSSGNCGTGVITGLPANMVDMATCTNIEEATGGAPSEGTESIRESIPIVTRAQRRGVVKEDYQALIEHLPGVLHCQIIDRNDSLEWPHLYIVMYVVPEGGGVVTTTMRDILLDECTTWGHLGTWQGRYLIKDWTAFPIDVSIRIGVSVGYEHASVIAAIEDACTTFFLPENQGLALDVDFGDLNLTLSRVNGVSWIEFDAPVVDTDIPNGYMATLGTVSVVIQD